MFLASALELIPNQLIANGLTFAFDKSSAPGLVICFTLLVLSCFSWAVMVTKFRMVRRVQRSNAEFLGAYRSRHNPLQLWEEGEADIDAPTASIYRSGAREIAFHLTGDPNANPAHPERLANVSKLQPSQMDPIECAMERSIGTNVTQMENQMSVLATAVSGAPFLGLLGTVWGVMDTFGSVASAEGAASLKTMAPGVSAALLTTVVALLVAIPAMFGYNYLVTKLKALISELDDFRNELRTGFERWYVDHGRTAAGVTIGRRIAATDLVNSDADAYPEPSHRVVKRQMTPDADPLDGPIEDDDDGFMLEAEELTELQA